MRQLNFAINIEKRMPQTGNVYMVDRMTSGYAERFPLDVNGFISAVVQEFQGTVYAESYSALLALWNAVLDNRNECGNASLYPNKGGACRPAAMKVWHKAGDYWRRGLRLNDMLPVIPPSCNITRMPDGGWIALFPKDKGLLDNGEQSPSEVRYERLETVDNTDCTESHTEAEKYESPITDEPIPSQQQMNLQTEVTESPITNEPITNQPRPRRQRKPHKPAVALDGRTAERTSDIGHHPSDTMKAVGMVAAVTVALFVIYETGLLISLGLLGLVTGGILK